MDISARLNSVIGALATAPVLGLNDPLVPTGGSGPGVATMSVGGTGASSPTIPAMPAAAAQAAGGASAAPAAAAPTGAAQAAAGAAPVLGGGAAPDQAALVASLTELVKVLSQLMAAMQAQPATVGGGAAQPDPTKAGTPGSAPGQSPMQVPVGPPAQGPPQGPPQPPLQGAPATGPVA